MTMMILFQSLDAGRLEEGEQRDEELPHSMRIMTILLTLRDARLQDGPQDEQQ
jgi:hypothetical protein